VIELGFGISGNEILECSEQRFDNVARNRKRSLSNAQTTLDMICQVMQVLDGPPLISWPDATRFQGQPLLYDNLKRIFSKSQVATPSNRFFRLRAKKMEFLCSFM
jgi:hypothetical protein